MAVHGFTANDPVDGIDPDGQLALLPWLPSLPPSGISYEMLTGSLSPFWPPSDQWSQPPLHGSGSFVTLFRSAHGSVTIRGAVPLFSGGGLVCNTVADLSGAGGVGHSGEMRVFYRPRQSGTYTVEVEMEGKLKANARGCGRAGADVTPLILDDGAGDPSYAVPGARVGEGAGDISEVILPATLFPVTFTVPSGWFSGRVRVIRFRPTLRVVSDGTMDDWFDYAQASISVRVLSVRRISP